MVVYILWWSMRLLLLSFGRKTKSVASSRNSDILQRLDTAHGDDLVGIKGEPGVHGLAHHPDERDM